MKKYFLKKIITLASIFLFSINMSGNSVTAMIYTPSISLLYDNVWSALYNPTANQCDNTPNITGDGSIIDTKKASELRWIAISQDLLNNTYRAKIINNAKDIRFKGKLAYGDTVWVDSPYKEINGWWVVKDAKNRRYQNSIDFLQSENDERLYGYNKYWSGKWRNIRIYKVNNYNYRALERLWTNNLLAATTQSKSVVNIKTVNKIVENPIISISKFNKSIVGEYKIQRSNSWIIGLISISKQIVEFICRSNKLKSISKRKRKYLKVYQYDNNYNLIDIWDSIEDILNEMHCSKSGLYSFLKNGNKRGTYKEFVWKAEIANT
jgi:hypothetical protein